MRYSKVIYYAPLALAVGAALAYLACWSTGPRRGTVTWRCCSGSSSAPACCSDGIDPGLSSRRA